MSNPVDPLSASTAFFSEATERGLRPLLEPWLIAHLNEVLSPPWEGEELAHTWSGRSVDASEWKPDTVAEVLRVYRNQSWEIETVQKDGLQLRFRPPALRALYLARRRR